MASLELLRDATRRGDRVVLDPQTSLVTIGSAIFPSSTRTAYKSLATNKFFELGALVLLLQNEKLKLSEYLALCKERNITAVPFSERKQLLDYLRGHTETSNRIDMTLLANLEAQERKTQPIHSTAGVTSSTFTGKNLPDNQILQENAQKRQKLDNSLADANNLAAKAVELPKSVADWDYNDILACEQQLTTRSSILQSKKSFVAALSLFDRVQIEVAKQREKAVAAGKRGSTGKTTAFSAIATPSAPTINNPTAQLSFKFKSGDAAIPIIVVPAAISSVITLFNVHDFLQQGQFLSTAEKRQVNPKKPDSVAIERSSFYDARRTVRYECIDDVSKLKNSNDWERVVAVFVSGAAWQFENWPKTIYSTPQAIFENLAAFHVYYDDEPINKNVQQWRVKKLAISKNKRYQDRGTVTEIWNHTLEFTAARNNKKRLMI
jgi:parafibromin